MNQKIFKKLPCLLWIVLCSGFSLPSFAEDSDNKSTTSEDSTEKDSLTSSPTKSSNKTPTHTKKRKDSIDNVIDALKEDLSLKSPSTESSNKTFSPPKKRRDSVDTALNSLNQVYSQNNKHHKNRLSTPKHFHHMGSNLPKHHFLGTIKKDQQDIHTTLANHEEKNTRRRQALARLDLENNRKEKSWFSWLKS